MSEHYLNRLTSPTLQHLAYYQFLCRLSTCNGGQCQGSDEVSQSDYDTSTILISCTHSFESPIRIICHASTGWPSQDSVNSNRAAWEVIVISDSSPSLTAPRPSSSRASLPPTERKRRKAGTRRPAFGGTTNMKEGQWCLEATRARHLQRNNGYEIGETSWESTSHAR